MHFNAKELLSYAAHPSNNFDKEGLLYIKEKHDGLFRRNEVLSLRWCRLKGNLFFYCKSKDQFSEPSGVFVLEKFIIEDEDAIAEPFLFNLRFNQDICQQFGATTVQEKYSWTRLLSVASYEHLKMTLVTLQKKIRNKAKLPNEKSMFMPPKARSFSSNAQYNSLFSEPHLELKLSCDKLICDGDGNPPSTFVIVSVNAFPSTEWIIFAQTEILMKSSNPSFFTTIMFLLRDVTEFSRVKLSVHHIKERFSHTSMLLGDSVFTLETLLKSPINSLRQTLVSPSFKSVGFISISAPEMCTKQQNAWLLSIEDEILWSKVERPRSYSLPSKLQNWNEASVLGCLRTLFENFSSQTYRFHTGLGAELRVQEIMSESKFSFSIPCSLLDLWINEEKRLLDIILQFPLELSEKQLSAANIHLTMINHYSEMVNFLLAQENCYLKKSTQKTDLSLEFVPVNLHIQRMWVQNTATRKMGVYDTITVGVFSAISQKFHKGGLMSLLNQLRTCYSRYGGENGNTSLNSDPISQSVESILRIEVLQEEIKRDLKKIIQSPYDKKCKYVETLINSICSKCNQLTWICNPHLTKEVSMSLEKEQHKVPSAIFYDSVKKKIPNHKFQVTEMKSHPFYVNTGNEKNLLHISELIKEPKDESRNALKDVGNCFEHLEQLDFTYAKIKTSILSLANKLQSLQYENVLTEGSSWSKELIASIKKLEESVQGLLTIAKMTFGALSLTESTQYLEMYQKIQHRRDIVFSQAITSVITGIMTRLWCRYPEPLFIHILQSVGVLCHFEGLLSCYGSSIGYLEDMVIGLNDLHRVQFRLEPSLSICNPQPHIKGNRLFLQVSLPVPQSVIDILPCEYSNGCSFSVFPVFFNVGINEKQTLAERFGDTSLQDKINKDGFNVLSKHFDKFRSVFQRNRKLGFAESNIIDLMNKLQAEICAGKNKNVEILHLSSEICKYLCGIRFTSCKSAKDRTGMSVTLEQAMNLVKDFNLDKKEIPMVLQCMRSEGTRRANVFKNVGVAKYHFNKLQLPHLPKLYKPPPGTYGDI